MADKGQAEGSRFQAENVLESMTDAFVAFDNDWRYTYVNAQAERIYQMRREEVLGRTLWEVFPEVLGSPFEGPYRKAMAEQTPLEIEGPFERLGEWFEIKAYPIQGGGLAFYWRDVSERKRAEMDRLDALRLKQIITDNATTGIIMQDGTGRCTFMNPAAEEMTGFTFEELRATGQNSVAAPAH